MIRLMRLLTVTGLALAALACEVAAPNVSDAQATPPWPDSPYTYVNRHRNLEQVLQDFANTFGVQLRIEDDLGGFRARRVHAFLPADAELAVALRRIRHLDIHRPRIQAAAHLDALANDGARQLAGERDDRLPPVGISTRSVSAR